MKKRMFLLVVVLCLTLCGCSSNIKNYKEGNKKEVFDDKWGITLELKDLSKEGATLVISQKNGNFEGILQTGADFYIEKNIEGSWELYNTNPLIDYAWEQIAYIIKENETTEIKLEWKWLYGELPNGKYRLNKRIMDFKEPGNFDEKIYNIEFEIKGD